MCVGVYLAYGAYVCRMGRRLFDEHTCCEIPYRKRVCGGYPYFLNFKLPLFEKRILKNFYGSQHTYVYKFGARVLNREYTHTHTLMSFFVKLF